MPQKFIRPKEAAIEAGVHSQSIYDAIRNRRLCAERRSGKVFIDAASFRRWNALLKTRRRLRAQDHVGCGKPTTLTPQGLAG